MLASANLCLRDGVLAVLRDDEYTSSLSTAFVSVSILRTVLVDVTRVEETLLNDDLCEVNEYSVGSVSSFLDALISGMSGLLRDKYERSGPGSSSLTLPLGRRGVGGGGS